MKVRNYKFRGHATGHVRDTFCDAVESFYHWRLGKPEPTVEFEMNYEPYSIPISRACTLVWNCTDIIPGEYYDLLNFEGRRTYAACARAMHKAIRDRLVGIAA
jgi:hypothetical protein